MLGYTHMANGKVLALRPHKLNCFSFPSAPRFSHCTGCFYGRGYGRVHTARDSKPQERMAKSADLAASVTIDTLLGYCSSHGFHRRSNQVWHKSFEGLVWLLLPLAVDIIGYLHAGKL